MGTPRYEYFKNHQEDWICPQIKSSATDNNEADFKTLGNELDMNYETTYASYSVYHNPNIDHFSLSNIGSIYNQEFMMQIKVWSGAKDNPLDYRIQPMAKQVLKFYFGDNYMTVFNIIDGGDSENLNKVIDIGNRQIYLQVVNEQGSNTALQIFVSRPGEKLNK